MQYTTVLPLGGGVTERTARPPVHDLSVLPATLWFGPVAAARRRDNDIAFPAFERRHAHAAVRHSFVTRFVI
jgi:hypothetical protein